MTAQEIEIAVADLMDYRHNVIVPNVHWGLGLHYEADLVVLRPSNWAIEVEIKTTAADIRADLKKAHLHDSLLFKELWFAVPLELCDHPDIPERAGILACAASRSGVLVAKKHRCAKPCRHAVQWRPELRMKLYELAAMRTWTLKKHLAKTWEKP